MLEGETLEFWRDFFSGGLQGQLRVPGTPLVAAVSSSRTLRLQQPSCFGAENRYFPRNKNN